MLSAEDRGLGLAVRPDGGEAPRHSHPLCWLGNVTTRGPRDDCEVVGMPPAGMLDTRPPAASLLVVSSDLHHLAK